MRTITKTIDLYTVKELSDRALETAHNNFVNDDGMMWEYEAECEIDYLTHIAAKLGITIDNLYYSGFSSQGDGACFIGSARYRADWMEQIAEYDNEYSVKTYTLLYGMGSVMKQIYDKCGEFTVTTRHNRARYYHEYSVDIDVDIDNDCDNGEDGTLVEIMREFMRFCYRSLEEQYNYVTSMDAFKEVADINEWEFDEDGCLQ